MSTTLARPGTGRPARRIPGRYRVLLLGQGVSNLGDQIILVAFPALVLGSVGTGTTLGICLALTISSRLLFTLFGGVLTDRYNPRRIALIACLILGLTMAVISLCHALGLIRCELLYGAAVFVGLGEALILPSWDALVPAVVPENIIARAYSARSVVTNVTRMLGPTAAAFLISLPHGITQAYALNAVSFGLCMIAVYMAPLQEGAPCRKIRRGISTLIVFREGLRYLRNERSIIMISLGSSLVSMCLVGVIGVGLPVVLHQAGMSSSVYGYIMATIGLGTIIGASAIWLASKRETVESWMRRHINRIGYGSCVAIGIIVGALASVAPGYGYLLWFGLGLSMGLCSTLASLRMQWLVAPEMRGRASSVFNLINSAPLPLASIGAAALAQSHPHALFVGASIVIVVVGLIWPRLPSLKKWEGE